MDQGKQAQWSMMALAPSICSSLPPGRKQRNLRPLAWSSLRDTRACLKTRKSAFWHPYRWIPLVEDAASATAAQAERTDWSGDVQPVVSIVSAVPLLLRGAWRLWTRAKICLLSSTYTYTCWASSSCKKISPQFAVTFKKCHLQHQVPCILVSDSERPYWIVVTAPLLVWQK